MLSYTPRNNIVYPGHVYSHAVHEHSCAKCQYAGRLHRIECSQCVAVYHFKCIPIIPDGVNCLEQLSDEWKCSDGGLTCISEPYCEHRASLFGESKHLPFEPNQMNRTYVSHRIHDEIPDVTVTDVTAEYDLNPFIHLMHVQVYTYIGPIPKKSFNSLGRTSEIYSIPNPVNTSEEMLVKINADMIFTKDLDVGRLHDDYPGYAHVPILLYHKFDVCMQIVRVIKAANLVCPDNTTQLIGCMLFPLAPQRPDVSNLEIERVVQSTNEINKKFWLERNVRTQKWAIVMRPVPHSMTIPQYLTMKKSSSRLILEEAKQDIIQSSIHIYKKLLSQRILVDFGGRDNIIVDGSNGNIHFIDLELFIPDKIIHVEKSVQQLVHYLEQMMQCVVVVPQQKRQRGIEEIIAEDLRVLKRRAAQHDRPIIQHITYQDHTIRVLLMNGEIYVVGHDLCKVLNTTATSFLEETETVRLKRSIDASLKENQILLTMTGIKQMASLRRMNFNKDRQLYRSWLTDSLLPFCQLSLLSSNNH